MLISIVGGLAVPATGGAAQPTGAAPRTKSETVTAPFANAITSTQSDCEVGGLYPVDAAASAQTGITSVSSTVGSAGAGARNGGTQCDEVDAGSSSTATVATYYLEHVINRLDVALAISYEDADVAAFTP